jgi:hypothetical protein
MKTARGECALALLRRAQLLASPGPPPAVSFQPCSRPLLLLLPPSLISVELIAVRKRIPHGQWEAWCADNINRSMRDIQKLMALAGANDPEERLSKSELHAAKEWRPADQKRPTWAAFR